MIKTKTMRKNSLKQTGGSHLKKLRNISKSRKVMKSRKVIKSRNISRRMRERKISKKKMMRGGGVITWRG